MNCAEFQACVRDFAYERLGAEDAAACRDHLRTCPDCHDRFRRACGLTCREMAEFLHEYLAGELPPERTRTFEEHVHVCAECEAYLDGYRRSIDLGRDALAADDGAAAEEVPDLLVQAILAARKRDAPPPA
jgi:anti-sigma factor RsiW